MVSVIVVIASAFVIVIPKIFEDANIFHWAATEIKWLKDNGISTGYSEGTVRPDNSITKAEMAAMLKRTAGTTVAAGIHVMRGLGNEPIMESWFNNVNGSAPTITGSEGHYVIDFQFPIDDRFMLCTMDNTYIDTRDAVCSVCIYSGLVVVEIFDISKGGLRAGGYWVMVYGKDIQP